MKIAIIGAGFSACNLYKNFKKLNYEISIFEKSRGAGGRCSTRYIGEKKIDHGTPYFKPSSTKFDDFCQSYFDEKILKKIDGSYYPIDGLNKICSSLINQDDLYRSTKILKSYKKDKKWVLEDDEGIIYEGFDELFVTIPAIQVLKLDMQIPLYINDLFQKVRYESVASLILHGDKNDIIQTTSMEHLDFIKKIVDNSKKYGYTDFSSYVFHSSYDLAKNISNKDEVKDIFLEKLNRYLKIKLENRFHIIPHFWKYAFVSKGLDQKFLYDKNMHIGFCGDYFGAKNLQSAFESSFYLFEYFKKIWIKRLLLD